MDEQELFFRRFPENMQDQVRGLVNYATLMGLTGKDLVSIGGKLDRMKTAADTKHNISLAESVKLLPIGRDPKRSDGDVQDIRRFKVQTAAGMYYFEHRYSSDWKVTSHSTKVSQFFSLDYYDLGRISYEKRIRLTVKLAIANGDLKLNF